MNILHTIKEVMLHPTKFFRKIQKEKGIKKGVVFLIVLAFFTYLFLTYKNLEAINTYMVMVEQTTGKSALTQIPINFITLSIAYIIFVGMFVGLSFLRYWVTHWFVMIFKGKFSYYQTYKAMVYSLTPEYFSAPLLFLMVVIAFFMKQGIIFWTLMSFLFIAVLALSVYQMYLRTKALSTLQKIHWFKAFMSIYILGTLTQLIMALSLGILAGIIFSTIAILIGGLL